MSSRNEKINIPDLQQKALPFFPPYVWREKYCGRCGDCTFIDDKFPVGWCESCVNESIAYYGKEVVMAERHETLNLLQKEFPNWRY